MTNDDIPKVTIFTDLDSLLDTRAACISSFGSEAMDKNITASYFTRVRDNFDIDGYIEKYSERSIELLKNSMVTPVFRIVKEFVTATLTNNVNSPHIARPCVMLNIHPYKLAQSDINTFMNILISRTKEEADIEIVDKSFDELTPDFVKSNLSMLVMYHGLEWLESQADAGRLNKKTCPDIGLLCPAIARGIDKPIDKNPFEIMEAVAAPIIALKFLPVDSFCMVVNPFKKAN
jgi:hypothetical protein